MNHISNTRHIIPLVFLSIFGLTAISCNAESNNKANQTFTEFWKEFRTASLNNDVPHVVKLTRFPFTVKADLDSGGTILLNKEKFKKKFKSFMDQDIRENLNPESMHAYIKKHESISPGIDDGQASVALFSFELIDGKWYFVRVYVEEI